MSTTAVRSSTASVPVEGAEPGWVKISFTYTIDGLDVQETERFINCVAEPVISDATEDFADVISRFGRDDEAVTREPIHSMRTISEQHDRSSFTLSIEYALPFRAPGDMISSALSVCDGVLSSHARAHLEDPQCAELADTITNAAALPIVHVLSTLNNQSPRDVVKSSMAGCKIALGLIKEYVPAQPMAFDDIVRHAQAQPDGGVTLTIGMSGVAETVEQIDLSGTGQYL